MAAVHAHRHVVVIGGGIVGLATARELATVRGFDVTVLEKESRWATHQTGHNSGVVHAGLYYRPGSLKARMAVAGNASMVEYARESGVPLSVCGKLVVATSEDELPQLHKLAANAEANGVPAVLVDPVRAKEIEPNVACVAALYVQSTAITDYRAVCGAMVEDLDGTGADLRTDTRVRGIRPVDGGVEVETDTGVVHADALVNCAGLHSDRIAHLTGLRPPVRIVPFRGEYYELAPGRRDLVRGLIYPVPDPRFPFLGVHLTRMVDGSVHAGPNAVLALRREGYRWRDFSPRDVADSLRFPGTWRLGRECWRPGLDEVRRSLSRKRFAESLARLVPAITEADIVPAGAGVRAQALTPQGRLVDDFLIEEVPRQVHVLNAVSPAATSSLEIARHVADRLAEVID
ncbi:L-2-hydroxyglutarate oxidase [Actinospica sp.]|jgi:L-2-hydroxyglutarate oxidase|uniref:L-2-hydroxyglutarate oxidase n=1 Tax=Actinospica sp. TaxID=1872142 RepID=UPI002BB9AA84|nr:L-2-hydroxyglutarate oxidase [Actinospica sp.]HWG25985.1 L-2-hydroxyglutarate oxidase [Actinospica sp.]